MIVNDEVITPLMNVKADAQHVRSILDKSKQLQRLSLGEVAVLLQADDSLTEEICAAAKQVKESIYGNRLVIFAPLYISNLCSNECLYCAFRTTNRSIVRRALSQEEILHEAEYLLGTGQKRVLLVSGEAYPREGLDYVIRSIETVYSARDGKNSIRRLNVNIAPLDVADFKRLKEANIGTYQLFQETYHRETYKKLHLRGPKTDYDYRLSTMDRAFEAGIDDVGIGILFGLYDYRYEVLALIAHIEHLEKNFGMGPHTISVPRLEPATGSNVASQPPYPVNDQDFKRIIAILRLAVPYTGIILSTRETPEMRRAAFDLGISQISAGSRTNPGGYTEEGSAEQFSLGDHRPLDDVIYDVCERGYIPSFCTSCYRLGRTGLDFMEYAKPGDIRKKCLPNALMTFQEYLEDYASPRTRKLGEQLIDKEIQALPESMRRFVTSSREKIRQGDRDIYV